MESYSIVIKNEKIRWYNRLGLFILFINGIYFSFLLVKIFGDGNYIIIAAGILISFCGIFLNFKSSLKNKDPRVSFSFFFILLAITWLLCLNYWLTAALIILAVFDFITRMKQAIHFFRDKIELHFFPKRTIAWHELNNAILKDRILTLDFKNDHLLQGEIDNESYSIDENEFTGFCRSQLSTHARSKS